MSEPRDMDVREEAWPHFIDWHKLFAKYWARKLRHGGTGRILTDAEIAEIERGRGRL